MKLTSNQPLHVKTWLHTTKTINYQPIGPVVTPQLVSLPESLIANKDALSNLSWDELKQRFLEQFGPNRTPLSALHRYRTRQQCTDEPLTHYLYEKKFLADQVDAAMKFPDFVADAISECYHNLFCLLRSKQYHRLLS